MRPFTSPNTWDFISRLLTIFQFLRKYDGPTAFCDLVAGITVGLTLIPQVIAYASLAGLEPQYGLYSALCGGFVYAILGTIPELNIAPTALLSLLTFQYTHSVSFGNVKAAIMLTFFAGIIELLCGILHLGFLIDFVSTPVVSAFTSAGALTIATSQIKSLFGLKYNAESFIASWREFFAHITEIQLWDTVLGFSCIFLLLAIRKLKDYGQPPIWQKNSLQTKPSSNLKKFIWFISVGRNAMIVLISGIIAFIFKFHGQNPFILTSKVPSGFPNFSIPLKPIEANNGTNGTEIFEMTKELGCGILVIPFVAIIANIGIAKAFAHGKVVDASQEMIAVGLCNIFGSFFGSYPVNASFSRAAVSSASGVRTPLSGIYTGFLVIMAFSFLTPYFPYIPKATLAAVIICAVVFMIEITIIKMIWNLNKWDLIPFLVTFISCLLLGIEMGILIGVLVELCKLLYFASRPKIIIKKEIEARISYVKVTFTSSLFFSSAEYTREKILRYCVDYAQDVYGILLDCSNILNLDFTSAKCFDALSMDLKKRGKSVSFLVTKSRIRTILEGISKDIKIFKTESEFLSILQAAISRIMPNLEALKLFAIQRIPILEWGPKYNTKKFLCDCIAGFTVGLTVMPQALAYATLGGLEPQYGLYSAFVGCFIYAIFGSIKDITIGPTALMALMTYQQVIGRNSDYAILLCFLTGCVQLIMSVLHLGVLVDFISIPVTVGFTSATSVIIGTSQLGSLLGLKISSNGFFDTIRKIIQNIHLTRVPDLCLGIGCIVALLLLRKLKDLKFHKKLNRNRLSKTQKSLNYTFWLIGTSRNAIIVVLCSVAAFLYELHGSESPFRLTGTVKSGLPAFQPPPFNTIIINDNSTKSFPEMLSDLGSSVFLVPIIAVLGNVAIAKAFASGEIIDATQELLTLSFCNILGSFFSSMPVTGSFSRSAVNHASGVQTAFGGVITGIMVLLALSFLTPYFAFIPKASLGAVIVCAVIFMIEYEVVKPMWKSSKKDLLSAFATFVFCLVLGVEYGILVGVSINIIFLLYPSARPGVHVEKCVTLKGKEYILIVPGNALYFPAVDFIKTSIAKAGLSSKNLPVVIDCQYILGADFTAAKGIAALINEFSSRKQPLYFLNARLEVVSVFQGVMSDDFVNFNCKSNLETTIEEEGYHQLILSNEEEKLLAQQDNNDTKSSSSVELKEIKCSSGTSSSTISHRKSSINGFNIT